MISFNIWVRYVVWNFLWNFIQNILPIHWKMCISFKYWNLRVLRFKSFVMPPRPTWGVSYAGTHFPPWNIFDFAGFVFLPSNFVQSLGCVWTWAMTSWIKMTVRQGLVNNIAWDDKLEWLEKTLVTIWSDQNISLKSYWSLLLKVKLSTNQYRFR